MFVLKSKVLDGSLQLAQIYCVSISLYVLQTSLSTKALSDWPDNFFGSVCLMRILKTGYE